MGEVVTFKDRSDSVAAHCDAMNDIQLRLKSFKPEDRLVLLSGCLGSCLCELGEKPGRSFAVASLGVAFECALDMINRTYGNRDGAFE